MKLFITGATGRVGIAVLSALQKSNTNYKVYSGTRDIDKDRHILRKFNTQMIYFDFEKQESYEPALQEMDVLFLLRPPQIADVPTYFEPLLNVAVKISIQHIIFLSVQGVENSSIIPHFKIEKLIVESGIPYTFLRPAYFMQNFTSTLKKEMALNKRIFLPAGESLFTLIDVNDIGAVTAEVLINLTQHKNQSYELTSNDLLTFHDMAQILTQNMGQKISFVSPNLFRFFIYHKKQGVAATFIFVMILLHYFPRFQKPPKKSIWVKELTQKQPLSFEVFVQKNANKFWV